MAKVAKMANIADARVIQRTTLGGSSTRGHAMLAGPSWDLEGMG